MFYGKVTTPGRVEPLAGGDETKRDRGGTVEVWRAQGSPRPRVRENVCTKERPAEVTFWQMTKSHCPTRLRGREHPEYLGPYHPRSLHVELLSFKPDREQKWAPIGTDSDSFHSHYFLNSCDGPKEGVNGSFHLKTGFEKLNP